MYDNLKESFPNSYKQRFLFTWGSLLLLAYLAALQVIDYMKNRYGSWIEDLIEIGLWISLGLLGIFVLVLIPELFRKLNVYFLNPIWNGFLKFMNWLINSLRNLINTLIYFVIRGAVTKVIGELESVPKSKIEKKESQEIVSFEYADVPFNHGWHDHITSRRRLKPSFHLENSALILRSPTEYHMDYFLNPIISINPSTLVQFDCELEENAIIYCQLKSNNDEQEYWLKMEPSNNEIEKIGFSEWAVPVNSQTSNGYNSYKFNLKSDLLKTFYSANLRPNKLTGFRIRGNIVVHKIRIKI